jgi:hypothetical protein
MADIKQMKVMKKKFFFIFLVLMFFACTPIRMANSIRGAYNEYQLDSICRIERLPVDLTKWHGTYIYDYETNERISQYVFIRDVKRNSEIIYTITVDDSTYYFNKRVVEQIKK